MRADAYFKSLTPFRPCLVLSRETGYAKPYSPMNKLVWQGSLSQRPTLEASPTESCKITGPRKGNSTWK
ncbi:Uncharacterized protein HZ326_15834 [Fusarium oxysporum f. sp. albedinis]|jgi:hypothetical protein|nr:Uncharacterized protein HZ326_15834 [Fusarium oxysporum f. sp. albedinis]